MNKCGYRLFNVVFGFGVLFSYCDKASASEPPLSLSGFATLALGKTTGHDEYFLGYEDEVDVNQASLFALQALADFEYGLGITIQAISQGSEDWHPDIDWAVLTYDHDESFRLVVGKQRAPLYYYSNYINVSYAYHWIRPPHGVYNIPLDTIEGVGAYYDFSFRGIDANMHFVYGNDEKSFTFANESLQSDVDDFMGSAIRLTRDWWTIRLAYFQAQLSVANDKSQMLSTAWRKLRYDGLADQFETENDDSWFSEFAFRFDFDSYFGVVEYTHFEADTSFFSQQDSFYISLGKQLDEVTVHFTFGVEDDEFKLAQRIDNLAPQIQSLVMNTMQFKEQSRVEQEYFIAGIRWDFHYQAALKFEYNYLNDKRRNALDAGLVEIALVTVF